VKFFPSRRVEIPFAREDITYRDGIIRRVGEMGGFKNRWSYDASIIAYFNVIRRATRDLSTHGSGNAVFFFSMATLAPELAIDLSRLPGNDVDAKRAQYKTAMLIEIIKHESRCVAPRIFEILGYFPFRSRLLTHRVIYRNAIALCRHEINRTRLHYLS